MKIGKKIYFAAVSVLLILFLVLGFTHAYAGGSKSKAGKDFLETAEGHAESIYAARTSKDLETTLASTQSDAEAVRKKILEILRSINVTQASYTLSHEIKDEAEDELLYKVYDVKYNWPYSGDQSVTGTPVITNYFSVENFYKASVEKQIEFNKAIGKTDDLSVAVDRFVNNIVVTVPGNNSKQGKAGDAILYTVHMDAPKYMPGAADTAMLGVALSEINDLVTYEKNNAKAKYDNDIIFLFTDARYDSSLGLLSFMDEFYGFTNVAKKGATTAEISAANIPNILERIKLAVNFDSLGNGESSMLLQTSENNSKLVTEFTKAVGGVVSSSFISEFYKGYASDFAGPYRTDDYKLNAVNLVTFGKNQNHNTAFDTMDNLKSGVFAKKADMLISTTEHFGSMDLSKLDSENDSVYFSFLGWFTVVYSNLVSYILGGLILVLMAAVIVLNLKKKAFSFSAMGKGLAVQLLSIAACLASMFVLYFVLGVILSGFGLFTIQSLISYVYSNAAILTGYMIFAVAMLALFYNITRKMFVNDGSGQLTALSIVRASAALFSLLAAVLCFAYPALAYMFAIPAVLFMSVMLILVILKKEEKEGQARRNYERMLFYLIPAAVALALMIPVTAVLSMTIQSVLMPIILLPLILLLAIPAPYVLMSIRPLNALVKRFPKRTIRVQRTVTERIPDKAKPGKFTEFTGKKITKEKISWRYRHGVGMTIIAVMAAVVIMAFSALSVPFGANVYVKSASKDPMSSYTSSLYSDAFLLSWTLKGSSTALPKTELMISDKAAYKYFRYALSDYSWDMDKDAYVKPVELSNFTGCDIYSEGMTLTVTPATFEDLKGVTEVTLYNTKDIKAIYVLDSSGEDKYEIPGSGYSSMTVRFPLDNAATHRIRLEYKTNKPSAVDAHVTQYIWDYVSGSRLGQFSSRNSSALKSDLKSISDYFSEKYSPAIQGAVRYGVVYNLDKTLSLT